MIRRRQRIVGLNSDFVLPWPHFVMGGNGTDAHLFQRQADVAADVFPAVERRDVQEARPIVRDGGRVAVFIQTEKVEFALCAEAEGKALLRGALCGVAKQQAAVLREGTAGAVGDGAVEPRHAPRLRPPGQHLQGGGVGVQHHVRRGGTGKAAHQSRVKGNAALEGAGQLVRHDGDIFQRAECVAERKADELDAVFRYELQHLAVGETHACFSLLHGASH